MWSVENTSTSVCVATFTNAIEGEGFVVQEGECGDWGTGGLGDWGTGGLGAIVDPIGDVLTESY